MLFVQGCEEAPTEITLYYSINEPMGKVALRIHDILEDDLNIKVKTVIGSGSLEDIEKLKSEKGHLAFQDGIKSLMPLYPQILHVFYKGEVTNDFAGVLARKNVFLGYKGDGSYLFAMDLLDYFNIDISTLDLTQDPFSADVLFGFTDIVSNRNFNGLKDYNLFSFSKVEQLGYGSVTEGISLKFPKVKPFIIPESTYYIVSNDPIMTLASDVVLVTSSDMPDDLIYDITKTLFRNLQKFNDISPLISQDLKEDFSRASLSFPLHNGARIFLDRDEPSFMERYAELIGVIFSILIAFMSGVYSLSGWMKQRKKDRIDVFYEQILHVKVIINKLNDIKDVVRHIRQIQADQQKAFQMLIDEKLRADESFRIYMELSKETIQELKFRYKRLQLKMSKSQ